MRPVMYLFANKGLEMSPGKLAAQVAHAAVEAYRISDPHLIDVWMMGGHYTKLVMEARDSDHLRNIQTYLNARWFDCIPIIDEGRTEVAPLTFTALGVAIVDRDDEHTALTFSAFKTYKSDPPKDSSNSSSKRRRFWR